MKENVTQEIARRRRLNLNRRQHQKLTIKPKRLRREMRGTTAKQLAARKP